ncbi:excisionase family DNA binding protein [Rhodococcus percolatus]|uniref:helix-turn-helix transcriptional regulator n=1 Tax=Rhodococcus opacus TaxID=37919 RepID=UPI0015F9F7B6|nr:excisionase family DNA-binding protein [Rhodococcus opacus]MBA8964760.1 excisionase family DNA binding protein [Rhodococcus opacus]MBP2208312.1 excisionase family DNA binding protein [Rhodococcus opacus]
MPTELLTIREAAARANVSRGTIEARLRDGSLTRYALGPKSTRIDADELTALLRGEF